MKILVLPALFHCDPDAAKSVQMLACLLRARGHDVIVLGYQKNQPNVGSDLVGSVRSRGAVVGFLRRFLDGALLLWQAVAEVRRDRPDVIHAMDESVVLAYWFRKICRIPYVYDMDALLADRVIETYPIFRPARRLMQLWLKPIISQALLVAPMCEAVAETLKRSDSSRVVILRDVSLIEESEPQVHTTP